MRLLDDAESANNGCVYYSFLFYIIMLFVETCLFNKIEIKYICNFILSNIKLLMKLLGCTH